MAYVEDRHEAGHDVIALRDRVRDEVSKAVVGQHAAIDHLVVAMIAGGHVLLEGPPGTAKTLVSKAVAHALGVGFNRIQFTPDTTPAHIIGSNVLKLGEPVFTEGPVFTNLLLADEINRTPPRTQAALLEAMQERHVTVDGRPRRLPKPFMVVATQNPYEQSGVYALPESQLDRFLFKIELDYPDTDTELDMLRLPHLGVSPDLLGEIQPQMDSASLLKAQEEIDATKTPDNLLRYVVAVVRATRQHPGVILGAGPRATIHLLTAAKANARLAGRDLAGADDVREVAQAVLSHRLLLNESVAPSTVVEHAIASAGD
jgi:MoxR-like ATPase